MILPIESLESPEPHRTTQNCIWNWNHWNRNRIKFRIAGHRWIWNRIKAGIAHAYWACAKIFAFLDYLTFYTFLFHAIHHKNDYLLNCIKIAVFYFWIAIFSKLSWVKIALFMQKITSISSFLARNHKQIMKNREKLWFFAIIAVILLSKSQFFA